MIIVMTSAARREDAEALAEKILAEKLAACVQVVPGITSFFFWDGAVQKENEHLLLIKTLESAYAELEQFIRNNHPYDVPEVAAISCENVSEPYLAWLQSYIEVK